MVKYGPDELRFVIVDPKRVLGVAQKRALEADGYNFHLSDGTVAGQVVMHAHLHIVPRWTDDSFHWNWRQLKYESDDVRNEMAEKLKKAFKLSSEGEEKE